MKKSSSYKTKEKSKRKELYKIDFILLLQFGLNESTFFSTRFNRFLVEKGPIPRRAKQRSSTRKK